MTIPFDLQTFAIAAAVVAAAYVIFGILASGATLVTVPVLSHFYLLDLVLPMCALLLPFALGGLWAGNRIHTRVSRAGLLRFVSALLLLMGVSLIVRANA